MKTLKLIALAVSLTALTWAQQPTPAVRHPAQITFRVLTDAGTPVPNVDVTTSTFLYWQPGESFGRDIYEENKGRTNAEGLATVSFTSERGDCNYGIYDVPGYYSTRNLLYKFSKLKGDRWEPWNPVVDVVLKPVLKPIPMYAKKMGDITSLLELPAVGQPVGFDLTMAEWVAPYGKGKVADLVFTLNELVPLTDVTKPFDYTLTVTFTNEGDGIQSVLALPHKGSDLRLPRMAFENGYKAKLEKRIGRSAQGMPLDTGTHEDQNYLFRVRTLLDEKGHIKSALYGKIHGDIACDVINSRKGYIMFTYYLNPTSLDRNLEYDPQHNLFTGLRRAAKINEP
jgi:hypothetical protein